ncbi:MAG: hypothetical protein JW854_10535 [Actinobacteria bacterium]|nr:hypothetical protein [Actinomycetota bacterium]
MKICPDCGAREQVPGATFCRNCGSKLVEADQVPPEPAAVGQAAPQHVAPQGAPAQTSAVSPSKPAADKENTTTLILGITVGVLSVVIIVLALWLTLWSGEEEATVVTAQGDQNGEQEVGVTDSGPEELALDMISSLEEEDADAFIACFEKGYLDKMRDEASGPLADTVKDMSLKDILALLFEVADIKITGLELETDMRGSDSAAVTAVEGEMEIIVSGDVIETIELQPEDMSVDFSKNPITFEMEKQNGTWYLVKEPFRDLRDELM